MKSMIDSSKELQDHFGPAIYIDPDTAKMYHPTVIDVDRLGENLQHDFPKVTQADWDTVQVHCTDDMEACDAGRAVNLLSFSWSARILTKASQSLSYLLNGPKPLSYSQHKRWSRGRDIVVAINLASKGKSPDERFFPTTDQPINADIILSHELHHAVSQIYYNKISAEQAEKRRKYARRVAAHLGVFATGTALIGAGMVDLFFSIGPDETMLLAGAAATGGGAILAAAPIYLMNKRDSLSRKRFGIKEAPSPYGQGEDCANAYALATAEKWQGVIA